jgi:hypothetical protein
MLFHRLLKKRRPAAAPAPDPQALVELARSHADPVARREAVRGLASLDHLREILAGDFDTAVREVAFGRYRSLLAGAEQVGIPLPERLAELARTDDPRLLEHLALEGQEPEVRRAAILRVDAPRVLVACVLHDPLAVNRGAAVARLADRESLEQVARQIGKKDKGVYRAARERLKRLAEEEERPRRIRAQCQELCERAERLGRLESWTQDRAILDHLDRQWAELAAEAEPEWRDRYGEQRGRFLAAYDAQLQANAAEIAAREARTAIRAERESLIAEAQTLAALPGTQALSAGRERLAAAWAALGALPEAESKPLERRFAQALEQADSAIQGLAERHRALERLKRTAAKVQGLLAESRPLDAHQAQGLLDQGRTLAAGLADSPEAGDFEALAGRLESRLHTQRRHAEQRLAELPERLAELESAAEAGELKRADPLHQSLQAGLELIQTSGLGGQAVAAAAQRLRTLGARVKELQQWRRWGADRHREALCDAMERLREEDLPLAAVAERLHVLQTDWKELDGSGSPANQGLWQRFHAASEQVYGRCRPYLDALAAERESNGAARESVCCQLESFLAQVDWERIDWRRVIHAEREIRQAWAAIGPCEMRQRKALERRFHKAIKELDQRLEDERGRNQAFKQDLIERVRALALRPDLDSAIEETKALQRDWHTTVPARQRDENRLWQAFRGACDAVFERRAALHQAHRSELEESLAVRQGLCAEAESLAESESDPARLAAARRDLERRWRDGESLAVPRQAAAGLSRRWQEARQRLAARLAELESAAHRAELDLLAAAAGLCESVERRVLALGAGEPLPEGEPEGALDAFAALGTLADAGLQQQLHRRLQAALDSAGEAGRQAALAAACGTNGERRRRLCLELEIAAGVESPPALAQERLKLQVARLAERLGDGEADRLRGAPELLRDWYLCGPAPEDAGLAERVARVRAALGSPEPADTQAA